MARPDSESSVELPSGITLAYETFGDPRDETLLLVMGLGGPMIWWHRDLCGALAARGYHVVRFDNRDIGHSSRVPGALVDRRTLLRVYAGDRRRAPYGMADMAADGFGLLDALGVRSAHVTGASMGGMIAQTMAITQPERVRSLVSIMSTTGARRVGRPDPRLLRLLMAPAVHSRELYVERAPAVWTVLGSPAYPFPVDEVRERAGETWDRGAADRSGPNRQLLAVMSQPDRTAALGRLRVPTCVIHGLADRLVRPSGGRATARAVPGAELVLVPGMGHDLPRELWPLFVDAIDRTAARARPPPPRAVTASRAQDTG